MVQCVFAFPLLLCSNMYLYTLYALQKLQHNNIHIFIYVSSISFPWFYTSLLWFNVQLRKFIPKCKIQFLLHIAGKPWNSNTVFTVTA
jgi:hypothetical protein